MLSYNFFINIFYYFLGYEDSPLKVAVLDLGIKKNIIRNLASRGVYVKVFPSDTTFETMSEWNPDGYFLSNGPGDPEPLHAAQAITTEIIAKGLPLFGICLGHQIIALSQGISTYKMLNGHLGHRVLEFQQFHPQKHIQDHRLPVDYELTPNHHLKMMLNAGLKSLWSTVL